MIPIEQYKDILGVLPILCVDIILRHPHKGYLLVKRSNEPLKDQYWVVGGRVQKGEMLAFAAQRKLTEEIGFSVSQLSMVGIYEDQFDSNPFNLDILYHTVSVVFFADLTGEESIVLDKQSSNFIFSKTLPERLKISQTKLFTI